MDENNKKLLHVYCFFDTNLLMEFEMFDQVVWPDVLNAKQVCLVLTPVVFRELDKHKTDYNNPRRQKRARALRPKLSKPIGDGSEMNAGILPQIRKNVTLLLTKEPQINWDKENLDPLVNDERLVANVLEFSRNHPSDNVILVSEDLGPRVAAIGRDIQVFEPPSSLKRLPDPPSDVEKENEKLKQQIQELTERMPTLGLGFYENGRFMEEITRPANTEWVAHSPKEYAAKRIDREREDLKRMLAQADNSVPESEIETFKKSYETYFTRLEPALKMRYISTCAPQCRLQLALVNGGSAPAHEIYLSLQFPEGSSILVLDKIDDELDIEDKLPDEPAIPAWAELPQPALLQGMRSLLQSSLAFTNLGAFYSPPSLFAPSPNIFGSRNKIYDDINFPFGRDRIQREKEKLIQQRRWTIDPLAVYLSTYQKDGFIIAYTIHTEEWPMPLSGELKVRWT